MKTRKFFIFTLSILAVLSWCSLGFSNEGIFEKRELNNFDQQRFVPDEIIVKFKPGVSDEKIHQINQNHNTSVLSLSKRGQYLRLRTPKNKSVEEIMEELRGGRFRDL